MLEDMLGNAAAVVSVALVAGLVCLWIAAARSIVRDNELSSEGKVGWIIAIFVAPYLGVIAWFAIRHGRRSR